MALRLANACIELMHLVVPLSSASIEIWNSPMYQIGKAGVQKRCHSGAIGFRFCVLRFIHLHVVLLSVHLRHQDGYQNQRVDCTQAHCCSVIFPIRAFSTSWSFVGRCAIPGSCSDFTSQGVQGENWSSNCAHIVGVDSHIGTLCSSLMQPVRTQQ